MLSDNMLSDKMFSAYNMVLSDNISDNIMIWADKNYVIW
jgi:hypothetical protein